MFFKPPAHPPQNILSHWYALIEGVQFSTQEFYKSLEDEIAIRRLPRLRISRVEYHEGSFVSDKRIYLRLARERYAFDLCAAPFGSGYFFSLRFVEKPRGGWLQFLGLLVLFWILCAISIGGLYAVRANFGWLIGFTALAGVAYWVFNHRTGDSDTIESKANPSSSGIFPREMPDFDAFFLNLPVIGEWYERYRKDTYFRHDTQLLYQSLITDIVKQKVDEVTAAKGVKLLKIYEFSPILGELYKTKTIQPGKEDKP